MSIHDFTVVCEVYFITDRREGNVFTGVFLSRVGGGSIQRGDPPLWTETTPLDGDTPRGTDI